MGFPKGFWHRKLGPFSGYFWVFLSTFLQTLFGIFTRIVFMRYHSDKESISPACSAAAAFVSNSNFSEPKSEDEADFSNSSEDGNLNSEEYESGKRTDSDGFQQESEPKVDISETVADTENFSSEEEESPKLIFRFEYQTWKNTEELNGISREINDSVDADSASANKYEFMSGKSFSHFLEQPEVSSLTVKELYVHSIDNENRNTGILSEKSFYQENHEVEETPEKSRDKVVEFGKDQTENLDRNILGKEILSEDDFDFLSEDNFRGLGFRLNSVSSADSLFESELNCSTGDGFLSDTDHGTSSEVDISGKINDTENAGKLTTEDLDFREEINSRNLDFGYEPDDFDEEEEEEEDRHIMMEELKKLEESEMQNPEKFSVGEFGNREKMTTDDSTDKSTTNDYEDSSQLETLWEHQDLIEQLKMELKKVRATGLPTILEDSEFPRMMDDLKPWKIDEKIQYGSRINDVPKLYRSYRERMRKFDILNYQKMYAIGFLQSKDPLQSFSTHKNSSPAITFRLCRRIKKSESDPMKKFIRELYSDLEVVYVGQLCLSWEFLMWEYEKALELCESEQHGLRRYNEVAGEFQQFQVLLQRFLENEPFQGPRVENYVKNRCAMKNLLQVPVIREDNNKDKRRLRKEGEDNDAITSDVLVEILEESIRTIWRFIKADKDASGLLVKGPRETDANLQEPKDSEPLAEVKADLQKKEKRLRDILRSGNCILRKFQKRQEDGTDQVLYFFSQVDMKLVWRVLNMSRITSDQLAWCHNKLNKINFVNRRRIHVEPSFLLFPC